MTPHNHKNPSVVLVPNPIDLDLAIQTIQLKLSVGVPWLEKVFGRAREIPRRDASNKPERVPMVYQSNGEYYPPVPNDALKSFSFFMSGQPRVFDDHKPFTPSQFVSAPMALIVWGNLNRIDPALDHIFTENLLNDVLFVLNRDANIQLMRVFDEKSPEVWRGLSINESHIGLLMYPYFAMRIEFMLRYEMNCTP